MENRPEIRPERTPERMPKWAIGCLVAVVLFLVGASLWSEYNRQRNVVHKTVIPGIRVGDYDLVVRNKDVDDWPGLTLYLNDRPPFTYNVTIPPLKRGETITIPLSKFTKDDGKRFDPSAYKVTEVWIGGGGYDYKAFGN